MTEAEAIAKRIESFGAGRAFTAADFSDVAGRRNAANALGRENVGDEEIGTLARNLTEGQVGAFLEESAGLTSWVADAAKKIWEARHGQDR